MDKAGKVKIAWAPLLLGLLIAGGCATTQETDSLQRSMDSLAQQVQSMDSRLEKLERQVQGGGEGKVGLANLYSRMEELQVKLGAVNGQIEKQTRQLDSLKKTITAPPPATGAEANEPRITVAENGLAADNALPSSSATGQSQPQQHEPGVAPQTPAAAPKSVDPEKTDFDKALQLYQQGQYENSRKSFQEFIDKHSVSESVPTALFWMGESYYAEKRYRDAIAVYQQILDRYPKTSRVPFALLKQANAFEQIGNPTAARILYEKLVDQHPNSPQAQVASKKLKDGQ